MISTALPSYRMPTTAVVARGGLGRIGELLGPSSSRVLLVTGKHSARAHGYRSRARQALLDAGKEVFVFDDVEQNPAFETVDRGAALAQKHGITAVVGLGGGSALDAAKAIAVCAAVGMPVQSVLGSTPPPPGCLFLLAIPTTAGTGSEATPYALLTDTKHMDKLNLATRDSFPDAALLDAELTLSQPAWLTRNAGFDALSHAVEGYLNLRAQPLTDALAELAIRMVAEALPRVIATPGDLEARERMLIAAHVAGHVIAHTGTTACHAMSYYLTLHHRVHHGLACAMLLGATVAWTRRFMPAKVGRIEECLGASIDDFAAQCGIATDVAAQGVAPDELERMAASAAPRSSVAATPGKPTKEQLLEILRTR